eukprot:CAMPEP_0171066964 /NCGR_PEP_ID=MMETSP0766_2-20121228/7723_1 /TAXON_ID=439317 /ORGANISM="Gambierdiscus australes, Strain CAWD 149" /LENGTH=252 /DNA_ID=CAMNT_0011523171 /DNA_START=80 /DNA_END=838 /DNA_ORIENTATION=+
MDVATEVVSDSADEAPCVVIKRLAGGQDLRLDCVPHHVGELKQLIAKRGFMPVALQRILREDTFAECADDVALESRSHAFYLVQDDTPLWHWDLDGNPARAELYIDRSSVKFLGPRTAHVNVVTQEPVAAGEHLFAFHIRSYGEELWCGLTHDKDVAGPTADGAVPCGRSAWTYRTGLGKGALEVFGIHQKDLAFVGHTNNVIGMRVDCEQGRVVFDLNGFVQGRCEIPKSTPLWVFAHLGASSDHVELRKP